VGKLPTGLWPSCPPPLWASCPPAASRAELFPHVVVSKLPAKKKNLKPLLTMIQTYFSKLDAGYSCHATLCGQISFENIDGIVCLFLEKRP